MKILYMPVRNLYWTSFFKDLLCLSDLLRLSKKITAWELTYAWVLSQQPESWLMPRSSASSLRADLCLGIQPAAWELTYAWVFSQQPESWLRPGSSASSLRADLCLGLQPAPWELTYAWVFSQLPENWLTVCLGLQPWSFLRNTLKSHRDQVI